MVAFFTVGQIEEKKYAHRRGSDVGGPRPTPQMGSPMNAMLVHSDVHSEVGSAPGSFKLPAMHDLPMKEPAINIHEDISVAAQAPVPDVPGVIHGKANTTSTWHHHSLTRRWPRTVRVCLYL